MKTALVPHGTFKHVRPLAKCGCKHATAAAAVALGAARRRYAPAKKWRKR